MRDEYQTTAYLYDFFLSRPIRPIRFNICSYIKSQNHRRILDICCGTGEQLRLLPQHDHDLTGIDTSTSMLKQAQKKSSESITYLCMDGTQIDFTTKQFDCTIISFGLHEKKRETHDLLFREGLRLVRPKGHIILCDFSHVGNSVRSKIIGNILLPIIERTAGMDHFKNYQNWMRQGALEGFCSRHGHQARHISTHLNGCVEICAIKKT